MTLFPALAAFLSYQGDKYMAPEKAGELRTSMLEMKIVAQTARKEFQQLAQAFHRFQPHLDMHRTSQWMNQAQIARPHFWTYFQAEGAVSEPMFALRLYGDQRAYGISVEVSFVERKKDEQSLAKQNQVLQVAITDSLYYMVQENGESRRVAGTEANRALLLEQLAQDKIRKVLVKVDVDLTEAASIEAVLSQLGEAFATLQPYYQATRMPLDD
ncbi:ribonuclease P [Streptococcus sp. zg-86]|uniref:Ribonuclease P n=1 Tax=Streptococcus zhangguiae TaxID=2664091 RepID=A0A6I4R7I4_9STRE|nr:MULTISPECIES: ribonuclease P [unclassified Streptococcus]MTB63543.1 ribonuclease P [Streptococcus sp. zg-86]MTB89808.1 ribonuclease P [Streptococcus sp. zg-36]MWV55479.1 ribonuclease P [Streptococcus sp. zg-70]QTH47670.1 ribonuclease P [Streptococcus sp. zg-86]